MDDLPFELFERIFSFLHLTQRIQAKRVSKVWKERIEHMQINCLVLTSESSSEFDKDPRAGLASTKLFDTNQFVDFQNCVSLESIGLANSRVKTFDFLRSTKPLLQAHLKQLVLFNITHSDITSVLNLFNQTQKLNVIDTRRLETKISICLPQLTALSLSFKGKPKIMLVASKLKKLELTADRKNSVRFDILFPSSIEYARFSHYHRCIEQMTSLKILHCDDIARIDKLTDDLLLRLTELEEVHANAANLFERLLAQKIVCNKRFLKLFYCGLQTGDLAEFRGCMGKVNGQRLRLYIENLDRLATQLPFATKLKYSEVQPIISTAPNGFWRRFTRLEWIKIPAQVNEAALIAFISQNRSINTLEFRIDSIAIDFLRRLAASYPFMRLILKRPVKRRCKKLTRSDHEDTLRSICFLKRLVELRIRVDVSLEMLLHLFTSLTNLTCLAFLWQGSACSIQRMKSGRYAFQKDQIVLTFPDFAFLADYLRLPENNPHRSPLRRPANGFNRLRVLRGGFAELNFAGVE